MTGMPDPRPDGMCAECVKQEAETNDGRFCKKCIKMILLNEYSSVSRVRDLSRRGTEEIGRSARDTRTLGGSAELNDWDDYMAPDPGLNNEQFGKHRGLDK